jgi:hypothetical protein
MSEPPTGPSQSCSFIYKLPKVQIEDLEDDDASTHTFPVPSWPGPLTDDFLDKDDNPLYDIEVLQNQGELLVTSLVAHVHKNYPRWPWLPQDFCQRMAEHVNRPGILRQAPLLDESRLAYISIQEFLRGKSRGKSGGYHQPEFDPFVQNRLEGIRSLLCFYVNPDSATYTEWGSSASMAAIGLG